MGAQGHVLSIYCSPLLLRLVLPGMERRKVGFGISLPPLRIMSGPIQHFYASILDAWRLSVFAKLSERKGLWGVECADFQGSLQLLTSSHLRERDKMLLRAMLCGGVWNGFLLGKTKKMFFVDSVARGMRWSFILGEHLSPCCMLGHLSLPPYGP